VRGGGGKVPAKVERGVRYFRFKKEKEGLWKLLNGEANI